MFDLKGYLENRRREVETALDRELPAKDTPPDVLHEAMRYSLFTGGKRLRPILCLAAAEAAGGSVDDALPAAVALEFLHTYTLIHDDLPCMDDDDERRGQPTVHVAFGEANAVLAGDALQALAFEILARAPVTGADVRAKLCLELARAAGSEGVVGGQVEDLRALDTPASADMIDFVHRHKTADLFRAALRMGAIAAGASEEELQSLGSYGANLGLAFQVTDDLLDEDAGDAPQETTCLQVMTPAEARNKASRMIGDAIAALDVFESDRVEPLAAVARFVLERKL